MIYRLAEFGDIDELVNLRLEMRKENDKDVDLSEMKARTIDFFHRNLGKTHIEFVAEKELLIVSTIGVTLFEVPPITSLMNGKTARMMNVYTVPEYRRKGIASDLLKFSIDYLKNNGYAKISLHSSDMGKKLYEKSGFIASKDEYSIKI